MFANAKYEIIQVEKLMLGGYQRAIDTARAMKYANEFDINKAGVIIVSERNGNYYIIDGQHRTFAAKLAKVEHLMCQVLIGLTYQQEAKLFKEINTTGKKPNAADIFKSEVESQDDKALEIRNIIIGEGFRIGNSNTFNTISAIGTINRVYKNYGSETMKQALSIIRQAWNGEIESTHNMIIEGIAKFISIYNGAFDQDTLVKQIEKVKAIVLIREAKANVSQTQTAMKMVDTLYRYYNIRLRTKLKNMHA
jgi:hypothetical protein